MLRFNAKIFSIFSALMILSAVSCSNKKDVVAKFDGQEITLNEFRLAYLEQIKRPNVFDSKELREKFLDQMITVRVLAESARELNHDLLSESQRYKIDAYRDKCLRAAHYDSVIKPKLKISEDDVEEAYHFSQQERRLSHLFATTKKEADELYSRLKSGESFEKLAGKIFTVDSLAESGGDLGWVHWDQLEYDLAQTAYRLKPGEYSAPVKSSFGYHILKVTDVKSRPLISRQEYLLHKDKARYVLETMLGEKYASEYVQGMLKSAKVKLFPNVAAVVKKGLTGIIIRKPSQTDQMYDAQLRESEISEIESNLWDSRNEVLATVNGDEVTIGEFIAGLNYIPYKIIYQSFDKAVKYFFRDKLLTQESVEMKLDQNETVEEKTRLFEDYILQLEMRRKIVSGISVSNPEIEVFYAENKEKFKKARFSKVKPIVEELLLRRKKRDAVPNFVEAELYNVKVEKNIDAINRFYDNVLNKGSLFE